MDYYRLYNTIIKSAQNRTSIDTSNTEIHHIKPASLCRFSQRYGSRPDYIFDVDADEPSNLVRLTYREHFLVHWLLAKIYPKMVHPLALMYRNSSRNTRSYEIARKRVVKALTLFQKNKWLDGTNNFCGLNAKRVADGTHNFLIRPDGSSVSKEQNIKRVVDGSHHFMGDSGSLLATNRNYKMIKDGTHISVNINAKEKFKKTRASRVASGNWHTCGVKPWYNNSSKQKSRIIYSKANELYDTWKMFSECGSRKVSNYLKIEWSQTCDHIIKMFREGWIPSKDPEWVKFKSSFDE